MAKLIPELNDEQFLNFMHKVDDTGGEDTCWNWVGAKKELGYGQVGIANKNYKASRIAYKIANGKDPGDLLVLHKCDNPSCVNPRHLFLGTHADNVADMDRKGRRVTSGLKGEAQGISKLKDENIPAIRKLHSDGAISNKAIGRMFGVTGVMIGRIVNGKNWTHIPLLALLLLLVSVQHGFSTDVIFNLLDPMFGVSQTTNRLVIVQAESGTSVSGGNVLLPFKVQQITAATGTCIFSNLNGGFLSGYYHVTIPAPPQRYDFDIFVSSTNLGQIQASTIIGVFGAPTYPSQDFSWTAQVSDARYARATNGAAAPITFQQLVITSNGIVNIIGTETNNIHVWGDKSFATTNQLESTNAALLGQLSFKVNQSDWITGSNGIRLALNATNTLLLAQINAGGSSNPTNDLSIALNRAQTNSTVVTSNALLLTLSPINPTNDLSIALNKAQTNSTAVTSNALILKIDATNLVNIGFSNAIANIYGRGTGTVLQTAIFIGVTNVKVLGGGSLDGSGMSATNFDTGIFTNQISTANVNGITNGVFTIKAANRSGIGALALNIQGGNGYNTNGGDVNIFAGSYTFVSGPFTGTGGNVTIHGGGASVGYQPGAIILIPGSSDSGVAGTNIFGGLNIVDSKNYFYGENKIRDGDDIIMRGVSWTNLISLKSSNGVQLTFGATNDWTISLSIPTNSFVFTNQIALYTLTTDFLVASNKQKVDLASTNALLLAAIVAGGSTNPTNDLNTALIARIAAATNSAMMVFWGTAPDPSGVLSAPKGSIYTFLSNNLPRYQLINTNGSTGWY